MNQITRADLLRIGAALFGPDPQHWRFRCAACGHVQSHAEALARNPELNGTPWIYSACEGRHTANVGCDWTLVGLFRVHTLEVFDAEHGVLTPCFEFAHERAGELVAAAAAAFEQPAHPTTDAASWEDFAWPEWIPPELRTVIERFWASSYGRGPRQWLEDAKKQGAPVLGSRVALPGLRPDAREEGRFVHCWNNIGRVLTDSGEVRFVSF